MGDFIFVLHGRTIENLQGKQSKKWNRELGKLKIGESWKWNISIFQVVNDVDKAIITFCTIEQND